MGDWLSSLLGSLLIRVFLAGTILVAMAMAVQGEYTYAAGLLVPLVAVVYLVGANGGLR